MFYTNNDLQGSVCEDFTPFMKQEDETDMWKEREDEDHEDLMERMEEQSLERQE